MRRRTTQANEDIAKSQTLLAISLEKSLLWAWISNKTVIKRNNQSNNSYHNNTNICLCTSYAPYVGEWVEYTKNSLQQQCIHYII